MWMICKPETEASSSQWVMFGVDIGRVWDVGKAEDATHLAIQQRQQHRPGHAVQPCDHGAITPWRPTRACP